MTPAPSLYARTRAIPDPGPLAGLLAGRSVRPGAVGGTPTGTGGLEPWTISWLRDGEGMIARGEVVRHKATDVADGERWWSEVRRTLRIVPTGRAEDAEVEGLFGAGPVAFGSFVFDPDNTAGQSVMIVPRLIVGRRDGRAWCTTISDDPDDDPDDDADGLVGAEDHAGSTGRDGLPGPGRVRLEDPVGDAAWEQAVGAAVRAITGIQPPGATTARLDKVVLARELVGRAEHPIEPNLLVRRLAAGYRRCWTYQVEGLVGSTPEMLIRREDGLATSRVLAGTIRRAGGTALTSGEADERDHALAATLSSSGKDVEEHGYAVASVAAALAPFCSGMNVPDAPYVLVLPNVLHLATDVTAVAHPDAGALGLAAALHPSAAVCGTPTGTARRLIAELEPLDRDRYAGPVGWIDAAGDGEWAIALRCGLLDADDDRRIRLFAGCGIVAGSDPAAESAEAAAKFLPMREALGALEAPTR